MFLFPQMAAWKQDELLAGDTVRSCDLVEYLVNLYTL